MRLKQKNNLQICAGMLAPLVLGAALYAVYLNIFSPQLREDRPFYQGKITKRVHLSYQNNPLIHDGDAFYFNDGARELHIHSGNNSSYVGFMIDYNKDGKVEVHGYKLGANTKKILFERPNNPDCNSLFLRKDATLRKVFNSLEDIASAESQRN